MRTSAAREREVRGVLDRGLAAQEDQLDAHQAIYAETTTSVTIPFYDCPC